MYDKISLDDSRLSSLNYRLEQIHSAWTIKDYEESIRFFVEYIPKLLNAERCSIFVADSKSNIIWLKYGSQLSQQEIEAPQRGSIVGKSVSKNKIIIENQLKEKDGFHTIIDQHTDFQTKSIICVPIESLVEGRAIGAIQVLNKQDKRGFSKSDATILLKIEKYLALALENSLLTVELKSISNRLSNNIEYLTGERLDNVTFIAHSQKMKQIIETVNKVCKVPVNVLITGESGTGKEVVSRLLHQNSDRCDERFVAVNCSAIPENLMESEFFGHKKGAFTGAVSDQAGRFEQAYKGTLFLDEIADMSKVIQPKFLRVLQENEGQRVGSNKILKYNFRLISATSKDLKQEIKEGAFREDLYFRIFSVEINIPPLRERKEDIIPLALMFERQVSKRFKTKKYGFDKETLKIFEKYPWPGNVRQLHHEIERLIALTPEGDPLSIENCSDEIRSFKTSETTVKTDKGTGFAFDSLQECKDLTEREHITSVLKKENNNKSSAAKALGISRQALYKKMKRLNIKV